MLQWFRGLGTFVQLLIVFGGMLAVPLLLKLISDLLIDFRGTIEESKTHLQDAAWAVRDLVWFWKIRPGLPDAKLLHYALEGNIRVRFRAVSRMTKKEDLLEAADHNRRDIADAARRRVCALYGHNWDGCMCSVCGARRNEQHHRVDCKCTRCYYSPMEWHDWDGCTCRRCGAVRSEGHDWSNGVFCTRCGAVQPHEHQWLFHAEERYCPSGCKRHNPPFIDEDGEASAGNLCPGPDDCPAMGVRTYERCQICGQIREEE